MYLLGRLGQSRPVLKEALALHGEGLHTGDPLLLDLEKLHARDEATFEERLESLRPLREHGDGCFESFDVRLSAGDHGTALLHEEAGCLEATLVFASLVDEHSLQQGHERRLRTHGRLESGLSGEQRAQPSDLHPRRRELLGLFHAPPRLPSGRAR